MQLRGLLADPNSSISVASQGRLPERFTNRLVIRDFFWSWRVFIFWTTCWEAWGPRKVSTEVAARPKVPRIEFRKRWAARARVLAVAEKVMSMVLSIDFTIQIEKLPRWVAPFLCCGAAGSHRSRAILSGVPLERLLLVMPRYMTYAPIPVVTVGACASSRPAM